MASANDSLFSEKQKETIQKVLKSDKFEGFKAQSNGVAQVWFSNGVKQKLVSYCEELAPKVIEAEEDLTTIKSYPRGEELVFKLAEYLKTFPYKKNSPFLKPLTEFETEKESLKEMEEKFSIHPCVGAGPLVEKYTGRVDKGDIPFIIYNKEKDTVVQATSTNLNLLLYRMGLTRKDVAESVGTMTKVNLEFNPYSPEKLYLKDHPHYGKIPHINIYTLPTWRKRKVVPQLKGFFKKLMEHLFVDPNEREYVYMWVKTAILDRNQTILYLRGSKGIGKTLFADLLEKLIGREYCEKGKKEHLTAKFNGVFLNTRLVNFEEVHFGESDDAIDRLKAFCNNRLAIEEKGQNSETVDNYASILFCINKNKRSGITSSERRFSIPEITESSLTTSIPRSELNKYGRQIEAHNHEEWFDIELAEFGHFLLNFKSTIYEDTREALRGEAFQISCSENLPDWQLAIINYVQTVGEVGKEISFNDLIKAAKKEQGRSFSLSKAKVNEFISDYLHRSECRLGEVVGGVAGDAKYENEYYLIPDETLLKEYRKSKPVEESFEL